MYSEVLATGTRTKIAGSNEDGYLVFRRGEGANAVYVALNTTDETKKISFKVNSIQTVTGEVPETVETMTDVYGNKTYAVVEDTVEITVPAMNKGGTAILVLSKIAVNILLIFIGYFLFDTKGILYSFPICDLIYYLIYLCNYLML